MITAVILLRGIVLAFMGNLEGGGLLGNVMDLASALFYAGVFYCSRCPGTNTVESMILGNAIYLLLLPHVLTSDTVLSTPATDIFHVMLFGLYSSTVAWLCFAKGIKTTPRCKPISSPCWSRLWLRSGHSSFWARPSALSRCWAAPPSL